jgi:hypothetical protein
LGTSFSVKSAKQSTAAVVDWLSDAALDAALGGAGAGAGTDAGAHGGRGADGSGSSGSSEQHAAVERAANENSGAANENSGAANASTESEAVAADTNANGEDDGMLHRFGVKAGYVALIHWFRSSTLRTFKIHDVGGSGGGDSDTWSVATEQQLNDALRHGQRAELVILASPAGGGKSRLLASVMQGCPNKLMINLRKDSQLSSFSSDLDFAQILIDAVGYSPSLMGLHEARVSTELCVVVDFGSSRLMYGSGVHVHIHHTFFSGVGARLNRLHSSRVFAPLITGWHCKLRPNTKGLINDPV